MCVYICMYVCTAYGLYCFVNLKNVINLEIFPLCLPYLADYQKILKLKHNQLQQEKKIKI